MEKKTVKNVIIICSICLVIWTIGVWFYFYVQHVKSETKEETKSEVISEVINDAEQAKRNGVADNIASYLDITTINNTPNLFGGYDNLKVKISNTSDYSMDKVEILVSFHRPSGEVCNHGTLTVKHLRAGEEKTLDVPKSDCGVSVECSLFSVHSKVLGLHFDNGEIPVKVGVVQN